MKAISKQNKKLHDKLKADFENNQQLSEKLKSDGETILSMKASEEEKVEGQKMLEKAKEILELNDSTKKEFLLKHSSAGSRQYQKRIQLA